MTMFTGKELIFRRQRFCEVGVAQLDSGNLGPGQLLLEVRYSLISQGTELANYTGLDPGTRQAGSWNCYPHRPGYASTGTVVAIGPPADGVPAFAIGDPVFAITNHARYGVADPERDPLPRPAASRRPRMAAASAQRPMVGTVVTVRQLRHRGRVVPQQEPQPGRLAGAYRPAG
jgi:NADPH:quinone reductase-like Zn-dependent oxidoreductase